MYNIGPTKENVTHSMLKEGLLVLREKSGKVNKYMHTAQIFFLAILI